MSKLPVATGAEIVRDAQSDPNVNLAVVEQLGNRTIVNVPLRLLEQPFGMLGTGTFHDEGVHVPTDEELRYLVGLAGDGASGLMRAQRGGSVVSAPVASPAGWRASHAACRPRRAGGMPRC